MGQGLLVHASHLDAVRSRLEAVWFAREESGHDQAAFGRDCGWILTGLHDRHVRYQELISYVEQSLQEIVRNLPRVATGDLLLVDLVGRLPEERDPVHLLLEFEDEPEIESHFMDGLIEVIRKRQWLEPPLADAAPVAEFAAPADPIAVALRAGGLAAAMAGVPALRRMLDDLAGDPEAVTAEVASWEAAAAELRRIAVELRFCLNRDFPRHDQPGVAAYLALMSNNVEGLSMLAAMADTLALFMRTAGDLIRLTRDIVRGLIGDLFAQVAVWAAAPAAVLGGPAMPARLATVVATTWRIHVYIGALTTSMASLSESLED
ncbi:hypothetical protein ACQP2F_19965 [Actinoplanes sp. CA-030573]|uniref:hypothetical protein n=1 Tax=Actinoplanes sp. CA-030573 TaxID=3239898 RepID=UPI003D930A9D